MVGCLLLCERWPAFGFVFAERKALVQSKRNDFTGFWTQFGGIRGLGCAINEESFLDVRFKRVAKILAEAPAFENSGERSHM